MEESNDVTLNFGEEDEIDRRRRLKHPVAVFFHLFFRTASLLTYLFCSWFSNSEITSFIIIIVLLSMDFWTVKNITGRLLVGLRWWNYVDDEGKSQWVFESRKGSNQSKISADEARIFWLALIITELIWIVFFFTRMFSFSIVWCMIITVGILMNGANIFGYVRCKYGSQQKMTSVASSFFTTQFFKSMFSSAASTKGNESKPGGAKVGAL
ncbi:hypothetical protein SNE40_019180 [Patella caerulea]|uniref:Golgi apparatus membrane protein TVP23 homolog n=1 Tax=Patella caerulea TaxID=87958 RepID=A0AAN8PES7_PATCE